jgi:hypothetical protein
MTKIAITVATVALACVVSVAGVAAPPSADASRSAACLKWKKQHGKRVCVRRAVTLAPSKRGHYDGATAQNAAIAFDVAVVGGKVVLRGMKLPELDETCTPGGDTIAFSNAFGTYALVPDLHGKVHARFGFDRSGGGRGAFAFDGVVDASGHASGTLSDSESLNMNGVALSCSTGTVRWSAGTGAAVLHPTAPPQQGHYHGVTAQGSSIDFDVTAIDGILYAQNLSFVEIDETCSPGQVAVALYSVSFGSTLMLVDGHGHLHFAFEELPASSLDPTSRTFTFDATIDSTGHALGTVSDQNVLADATGTLSCVSGQVTWSATRT